ncbi:AraC family transcriptional regulator [Kribbella sp. NPDC006257]|uniref:AraC family transcriptional regulator n=1 Tax=Kribbella sp. NPDC006257 TaxID=3156738 RepID=UPI0033BE0408
MPETLHEVELFVGGPVWGGVHRLNEDVEPHAHDFLEIAVVGAGSGRHETSQGERSVRHGMVVVLRPGAWHAFRRTTDLVVANCCVSMPGLQGQLAGLQQLPVLRDLLWTGPAARAPHGVELTQVAPDAADEAIEEIAKLEQELSHQRAGRVLGRLVTVLGIMADGRVGEQAVEQVVHPAVVATVARLEGAIAEAWSLDDLAQAVSLDPAYLSRLFRRDTGLSPLAFLARQRAERAAVLLAQTDLPAARVGAAVGWTDPTYFARRFRSLVGSTPTEYRNRSGR